MYTSDTPIIIATLSDSLRIKKAVSDARTIMGDDGAALPRLWREERAEVEREDLPLGVATNDRIGAGTRPSPVECPLVECGLRGRCHFSGVVALELSSAPASVPDQE